MKTLKDISNIHILLVEDNPRYLETLIERLESFGYQYLTSARNAAEAQKILIERHFDILVIDMKMEKDKSGFTVLDAVRTGNLASIAIILTAIENVEDCREALKGRGAWDYIPKAMSGDRSGVEELHKSIQEAITYFNHWGNFKDETWINEHLEELRGSYPGRYIAVINNSVLESADTREALEQRIQERRLPLFLTVIKKIEMPIKTQLVAELTIFVEGPTDVAYLTKALNLLEPRDLLNRIHLDNIGDETGQEGSGIKNLAHGFNFLKNNPKLRPNKVLFLCDQDVKEGQLPNKGKDFENLYVRPIGVYDAKKKGIEFLFGDDIFEEGFERNLVQKDLGRATKANPAPKPVYEIKDDNKMKFCHWICEERNKKEDFVGFQKIMEMIEQILNL